MKPLSADDSVGFPHVKVGHCQKIDIPNLRKLYLRGFFFAYNFYSNTIIMANLFSLPIFTVKLAFGDKVNLVSPLLIPEAISVNQSSSSLTKSLIKRLEASYIKQGEYLEILRHTPPSFSLQSEKLSFSLEAFRKRPLYPDLTLAFDYFYTELPNQDCLGFLPVLGIEAYADSPEELIFVLQRAIELEFTRKKRFSSVRRLISTQWYQEITVKQELTDARFHSLSELENLDDEREQQWLPEIAQALKPLPESRCFGRESELEQMLRALTGKYNRNLLLVGRAGVGKTALVEELVRVFAKQGAVKFWETTAARMLQKLTIEAGWEESLGNVLEELRKRGDILYVRNLAQLFEVGAYVGNSISMAEFMREHLAMGSVRLITECSDEELATIETRAPGYSNLFQVLRLDAPPLAQQSNIVSRRLHVSHPKQAIPKEAIEETLRLQHRYSLYSGFPGKTVHFLESLLNQDNIKQTGLDSQAVIRRFSEESGMPRFLVDSRSSFKLDETQQFFKSRLFGQDEAIDIIVDLLASVKTRLTRPGKPLASLLFVGPTGVGKTELAKALAEFMFGDSQRMIRFDMSEFSDEIAVLRLTGDASSAGQGLLTDKIRQQPFSVVLFDELEKAHFAFYDLLLQLMGEGRLTDARGQVADFCSSVIIMTSNIGAGVSQQRSPGFHDKDNSSEALHQHYLQAVQHFFRPELFNRLDQVIPFNALSLNVLRPIVRRELDKIKQRDGLRTRDVFLQVEESVIDYLANLSKDSQYGARQLQRCLYEEVVIPLTTTLNRYPFSATMKVIISKGENGLYFKTVIETQKARADQTLADSKWTLRKLTTAITTARRFAQEVNDGPAMNQLWSKWDILERDSHRKDGNFWQNSTITHEYGKLDQLLENGKTLLQQIENIEIDSSLAFIGMNTSVTGLASSLHDWQKVHEAWQLQLLDVVQPELGHCVLAIYGGERDYLLNIYNMFKTFITDKEWTLLERAVWLPPRKEDKRSKYYSYTEHFNSPIQANDKLVGIEIEIIGAGARLYFAKEGGKHIWVDREQQKYSYAVLIGQGLIQDFQTPEGVYRKKFLDGMGKKREYSKNGFENLLDKTIVTSSNWLSVLQNQLDDNFKELLSKVLCGEVIEDFLDDKFLDDDLFLDEFFDVPF